jgi:hypothetical protein
MVLSVVPMARSRTKTDAMSMECSRVPLLSVQAMLPQFARAQTPVIVPHSYWHNFNQPSLVRKGTAGMALEGASTAGGVGSSIVADSCITEENTIDSYTNAHHGFLITEMVFVWVIKVQDLG